MMLPGTTLTLDAVNREQAFDTLMPVFALSGGGLGLSQVAELTGLLPTTIQNWVKRGWVEPPEGKRYAENRVARILLINLLRPAMKLERITALLGYVNGRVDDRSDDILPDRQLYDLLCAALWRMSEQPAVEEQTLAAECVRALALPPDASRKLTDALLVMLLSVAAANRMMQAETLCCTLLNESKPVDS